MKKVLAFALTLGMILAMAACGSEPAGTGTKPAEAKAQPAKTDMGYAETKPNGAGNADSLYMDRKYPVIRTQVTDEVREAEGLTVTLEKIEFRKGLTLCFFRIINEREDGRSARIRETPTASFREEALQVDTNEWIAEMDTAKTPSLRVEIERWTNASVGTGMTYYVYRMAVPESTIESMGALFGFGDTEGMRMAGAVAMEGIEGEGELRIQLSVELLKEESDIQTVPFEFVLTLPAA